jgi:hypothetical protein
MITSLRVIEQSTNAHVPFRPGKIIDFAGEMQTGRRSPTRLA